jgi:hypothetical protein
MTKAQRREFQRAAKGFRERLEQTAAWPRDARAWARYDRLMVLMAELEHQPTEDHIKRTRLIEEIAEWLDREHSWRANYPLVPPVKWTRRPAARTTAWGTGWSR